jgi:hypothetical protein
MIADYRYNNGTSATTSRNLIQRIVDSTNHGYVGFDDNGVSVGYGSTEVIRVTNSTSIAVGTNDPDDTSIIDIQSTTQGVRFPNMTTTQKNAISTNPSNKGLVIFDITLNKLCVSNGSSWQTITSV